MPHGSIQARLRRVRLPVALSMATAGLLAAVALVRLLSYARSTFGYWIRASPLGFLAYRPESAFNVRYFKILATLSFVSFVYFLFRIFNRGHRQVYPDGYRSPHEDLDFRSPWLRLVLIAVTDVQWVILEWYKFATKSYPYSPLESWRSNAVVLALGSLIAFFGMKHLSFEPLLARGPRPPGRQGQGPSASSSSLGSSASDESP